MEHIRGMNKVLEEKHLEAEEYDLDRRWPKAYDLAV